MLSSKGASARLFIFLNIFFGLLTLSIHAFPQRPNTNHPKRSGLAGLQLRDVGRHFTDIERQLLDNIEPLGKDGTYGLWDNRNYLINNRSYNNCTGDFWDTNPRLGNWGKSHTGPAFEELMSAIVVEGSKEWQERQSEVHFVLQRVLGWDGVACNTTLRGCINMPTCEDIRGRVSNDDVARRIYFYTIAIQNFNLVQAVIHNPTSKVESRIMSKALTMGRAFYPYHSTIYLYVYPDMYERSKRTIVMKRAISARTPFTAGLGYNTIGEYVAKSRFADPEVLNAPPWMVTGAIKSLINTQEFEDVVGLLMSRDIALSQGDGKMYDDKHRQEVVNIVAKAKYDTKVDEDLAGINYGRGLGVDGGFIDKKVTELMKYIRDGIYLQLQHVRQQAGMDEQDRIADWVVEQFTESFLTSLWVQQSCHLHCYSSTLQNSKPANTNITEHRFNPVAGTTCQAQCGSDTLKFAALQLSGIDQLRAKANWGFTINEIVKDSFSFWQDTRYNLALEASSVGGLKLPVCYTEFETPGDQLGKIPTLNRRIPCICGNSMGNETGAFYQEDGFATAFVWNDGKGAAERCQHNFEDQRTPPVQNFLTLCELNTHFPTWSEADKPHELRMAKLRDFYCDSVEKEVVELEAKGLDYKEINCHFCYHSLEGHEIKVGQRAYGKDFNPHHRNEWNFAKACNEFEKQWGVDCKKDEWPNAKSEGWTKAGYWLSDHTPSDGFAKASNDSERHWGVDGQRADWPNANSNAWTQHWESENNPQGN